MAQHKHLHHPNDDHDNDHADEEVGRRSEDHGRFPHTAQVAQREQQHNSHRNRHFIWQQRRECRGDSGCSRADAYRNRQNIIDRKRSCGNEPRALAQVIAGHNIGAAAVRIGIDGLPVGKH